MCQHLISKGYKRHGLQSLEGQDPAAARGPALSSSIRRKPLPRSPTSSSPLSAFRKTLREVFLGSEGALAGIKKGGILVDMTDQ